MYSHGYNWREEPEGTSLASVVLLLVFVGAAAFLLSMMYFQPWDEGAPPAVIPEAQAPPAAEGEAAAQPPVPEAAPPGQ
jgi:hypothetical protein